MKSTFLPRADDFWWNDSKFHTRGSCDRCSIEIVGYGQIRILRTILVCHFFYSSIFHNYSRNDLHSLHASRRHSLKGRENRIQLAQGHHRFMFLTVLLMSYILARAAVLSHIEGWRYLNTVYWADITVITIGFGDIKPKTHLARSLLLPYAAGGVVILFSLIFCITKLVLDLGSSLLEVHTRDKERLKKVHQLKRKRQREGEEKWHPLSEDRGERVFDLKQFRNAKNGKSDASPLTTCKTSC